MIGKPLPSPKFAGKYGNKHPPSKPNYFAHHFLVLSNSPITILYFHFPKPVISLSNNFSSWCFPLSSTSIPATTHSTPLAAAATIDPARISMDSVELKRVFQIFDRNGDGHITKKELNDSLENLGLFIADQDLSQMIAKSDANGDNFLDVDEFGVLYQSIVMDYRAESEEADMREAFNVFDQNGDGFITAEELASVLSSLGIKQGKTDEDCRLMIMKIDVDGDGRVNFNEFQQMMKKGGLQALN